jgi:hypothetical protein
MKARTLIFAGLSLVLLWTAKVAIKGEDFVHVL